MKFYRHWFLSEKIRVFSGDFNFETGKVRWTEGGRRGRGGAGEGGFF